jgi:phospholipase/carboxylesterase
MTRSRCSSTLFRGKLPAVTARLLCAWLLLALACSTPHIDAAARGQSASEPLPLSAKPIVTQVAPAADSDAPPDASGWGTAAGLRYLEIVRGEVAANAELPLLLVIHGLGDQPQRAWLNAIDVDSHSPARMILPQAPTPYGRGFAWFEYRFADQDPAALARGIAAATERLARMITVLQTQRPSRGKAVVSGFSQGGMLSYSLALSHPELIAFALPVSGMLPEPLWPATKPASTRFPALRALHGTADPVVAFAADAQLAKHLRELGYTAELVPFPDVGHSITAAMSLDARSALSAALAPAQH